ncbi:MAG: ADP-dependent glucokinase/phosphofructokinase [Limnochordia bacterium]|jgi:ADP-dependent phosphofructokinase/glucokinase
MDLTTHWNDMYRRYLPANLEKISQVPGVILGFHSTIDGLKGVNPQELENILREDDALREEVLARQGQIPLEINSPADLLVGLLDSMQKGKALQLIIRSEETFRWTMENFGYDRLRIGGTSGNMANYLSPIGFEQILVYANPLTKEQAELFIDRPNLFVMVEEDGEYVLKQPRQAYEGEGVYAVHWIFEYPAGLEINIPGLQFTTPRANRYIAAWNPINNRLQVREDFKAGVVAKNESFSHFVISGFHILSENYPDGSTYRDCLQPVADYLKLLGEEAPHMKKHYEFASIASSKIRKGIVDLILPLVDSLGLNEVEMVALLKDIGQTEVAAAIEGQDSIEAVLRGVEVLMEHTGLKRVHLHDLGYYLCLVKEGFVSAEATRSGLLLAATLAAARSAAGTIEDKSEIEGGLDIPLSTRGLEKFHALAEHLKAGEEFFQTGTTKYGPHDLAFLPTKVVPKPVLTVGLGDIISSSSFIIGTL